MQPFFARVSTGMSFAAGQHPYLVEIRQIVNALARLPNLTNLSLLSPPNPAQGAPSNLVLSGIMAKATSQYTTTLQRLRIDFDSCRLESLTACRELNSLQLVGFSETNAGHTAEILARLDSLERLIIIGPPRGLHMRQGHGHQSKIVQSIDHRVLARIQPLKHLVIKEAAEAKSGHVFLTTNMLGSIYDRHSESLRVLHISSSLAPDVAFTTFLEALLMMTPNIRELALTWPGMQVAFVECVPASVQRLSLLVTSYTDAQAFVDRLQAIQYRLPFLRHIRFEVVNGMHETCSAPAISSLSSPLPPPQPMDIDSQSLPKGGTMSFPFMLPIQNLCL